MVRHEAQQAVLAKAMRLHRAGELEGAIRLYEKFARKSPQHAVALNLLGLARFQAGDAENAARSIEKALSLQPDLPDAHFNLGTIMHALGRYEDAVRCHARALEARPEDAEAHNALGAALKELGRYEEAIEHYVRAVRLRAGFAEAHYNLGAALLALGRPEEAGVHFSNALSLKPAFAEAHLGLGRALALLGRNQAAIEQFRAALRLKPDDAEAHASLAAALGTIEAADAAVVHFDQAVAMVEADRDVEAAEGFRKVLAVNPDYRFAKINLAISLLGACDWSEYFPLRAELRRLVESGRSDVTPFGLLWQWDDPALHYAGAKNFVEVEVAKPQAPLPLRWRRGQRKARVAYLSADFRNHVVATVTAEMFERHDRSNFEFIGVSFGRDDNSEQRKRVVAALDQFHDVRRRSDEDIAAMVRELDADIAVDLNGHSNGHRMGIFAHRAAPIQVNYLGYPGTSGAEYFDYIVADSTVLPFERQAFVSEKIVHLPGSYLPSDRSRKVTARRPTRREHGLPEDAFVFCCFNNGYKINPDVYDVWMRLLAKVEGSVVWLRHETEAASSNLRREAEARGIDARRLVFAQRVPIDEHLARHDLADLFLDTLPYNAHATANDALWAGLPVLTCAGQAFAGRVAASLLNALGVPELVTHDFAEYEALALKLANERNVLQRLRRKIRQNRDTHLLFDTDRHCRHLEAAYATMLEIAERGEPPRSFAVPPA